MSNFTIVQAAGAQSTGGASSPFFNPSAQALSMFVSVTSCATVSVSNFAVWAQGSLDNGATWVDLPFQYVLKSSGTAAGAGNLTANSANLVKEAATVGTANYFGRLAVGMPYMRVKWDVAGTTSTAGENFSVMAAGLNTGA